ncbi:cyclic nucleotide-gated ion channel 1-like [Citrus sinensis]|nr:cyclic nucleotide-gated ion channel 1-like [Citrus sinensis]
MSQDPEAGSRHEQSKVHGNGKISADQEPLTCFGCVKNLLVVIFLFLLLLCLIIFGGIMLVLYVVVIIIVLYHKVIASAIQNKECLLVNVIAMILDPLFFYILVLNDEKKCIHWDKTLGITATVIRSVLDFLKLVYIIFELHKADKKENQKEKFKKLCQQLKDFKGEEVLEDPTVRMWMLFLIDSLAILPIPQVLVIFGIRGTEFSTAMTFFVLQYLLRVIRTYFVFTEAIEGSGVIADATWVIFAFYVLLYLQSGHMFGALWYYYAIRKVTECWREACKNHTGCGHISFACNGSFGDYNFLNDFCPISTGSTTRYSFGLYNDALQSGIVAETDFLKKLLHCLHWGLQKLSAFGQDLETSDDVGENIFAIWMTIYGVVLFVFLIGRMQIETARSQKINPRWQGLKQSKHYAVISGDRKVLRKFKKAKRENLVNKHVDVHINSFLSDLSQDAANEVKRLIGRTHLEKMQVNEFENWSEKSLGYLCEFLKPVLFIERTRIIRAGDPIDEMIFVLKGKLWTYASRNVTTTTASNSRRSRENHLEDGDFFGKELIAWAQDESSSNLPISNKTIQALTDVEAFTLIADDLKHVLSFRRNQAALFLQSYWRFREFLRERRLSKNQA